MAWPPHSADLTPCEIFSWERAEYKVYSTSVDTIEEHEQRTTAEVLEVSEGTSKKVCDNTKPCLNFIKMVESDHIYNILYK